MWDKIKELYYNLIPFEWRPSELWYSLCCNFWHKYRTIKPRTLKGQGWCDKDILLIHSCFEILSQYIEKEQKEYKEEDYAYYYTEKSRDLILFGNTFKEPHYILDYLYRWWKFYLVKEEHLGDVWHKFNIEHCKHEFVPIPNSNLLSWESKWDTPKNEAKSKILFKRYTKKSKALHKELENNLILLILCKDFLWS